MSQNRPPLLPLPITHSLELCYGALVLKRPKLSTATSYSKYGQFLSRTLLGLAWLGLFCLAS